MKAVMYGAGSIGRGFIGALFSKIGYEVVFIDVNDRVIELINQEGCYPQIIMNERQDVNWITNIRAVDGKDEDAVIQEIKTADIMATAVGASILERIAPLIAKGLMARWDEKPECPLDILICENLMDADKLLLKKLKTLISEPYLSLMKRKLGLVETSIGRMVPPADPAAIDPKEHPLAVRVEAYDYLPVDRAAFKGTIPQYEKIVPYEPFHYYLERKLYIHNMAHVTTAYLGQRKGAVHIDEAANDIGIQKIVMGCMTESALMLFQKYDVDYIELQKHMDDLIWRFQNRYLKDTVERVVRDPIRKLQPSDRLVGAARACEEQGITPVYLAFAIALAVSALESDDVGSVLENVCLIKKEEKLHQRVMYFYQKLKNPASIEALAIEIEELQSKSHGEII